MAAALLTGVVLSILGFGVSFVTIAPDAGLRVGFDASSQAALGRHISLAIFATLVNLLSHSMMMFYLIGKGRAVRDAMLEAGLTGHHDREVARARRPVFSWGTLAVAATIVAALLGAGADTGTLPPFVHAWTGYAAIAVNLLALRHEIQAVATSARIVEDVNRLLQRAGRG